MAGEYSRELSVKVFAGQCRLIEHGFRQGGPAGFGLRRLLIDEGRNPKGELGRGDRKSLQTDRVVLTPVLLKKSNTFKASTRCSLRRVSARTSLAKDVRTLCTTLVRLVKLQGTRFAGATSIEKSDAARSPVPPHYMAAL
jgi:hypothetical protein